MTTLKTTVSALFALSALASFTGVVRAEETVVGEWGEWNQPCYGEDLGLIDLKTGQPLGEIKAKVNSSPYELPSGYHAAMVDRYGDTRDPYEGEYEESVVVRAQCYEGQYNGGEWIMVESTERRGPWTTGFCPDDHPWLGIEPNAVSCRIIQRLSGTLLQTAEAE